MNAPVSAASLLASLSAQAAPAQGECPTHGAATVLTRIGAAWHCPQCLDIAKRAEIEQLAAKERRDQLHAIAEIPERFRGQRFQISAPAHKVVRGMAAQFRDFITTEPRWAALILVGDVGTGKTQLACEFAESYINRFGKSVRYITAKSMISEIQSSYGRDGKSEDAEIDRFAKCDLLILDEIDAIPSKDNAALLLTEIINRRYGNNKPVAAITNQSLANLGDFVGDRVRDRLRENAFICSFDWASFRGAS